MATAPHVLSLPLLGVAFRDGATPGVVEVASPFLPLLGGVPPQAGRGAWPVAPAGTGQLDLTPCREKCRPRRSIRWSLTMRGGCVAVR